MALSVGLELKQGQQLVMTPQLQQAIKLLQLSNLELTAYVESELERNPLLERKDEPAPSPDESAGVSAGANEPPDDQGFGTPDSPIETDQWLEGQAGPLETTRDLDTDYDNIDPEAAGVAAADAAGLSGSGWASLGPGSRGAGETDYDIEAFLTRETTLHDYLREQAELTVRAADERLIALHLIDMVDESGYLRGDLIGMAEDLGAPLDVVNRVLGVLQSCEPAGVFARDLAECLAIQLQRRGRYDPMIAAVLDNLDLLAAHDFTSLRRLAGASTEDLTDIIHEIKALNPKPGLEYGGGPIQPVVPDVIVRQKNDGTWHVELNSETLPKVLINQSYFTSVSASARDTGANEYLHGCLQSANWLVKSLDQRARTILRVATEIVRQQDAFLTHGVQYLRPLNLRNVADAIDMHESTVSRVTSNKYMSTTRGIFELKYFFTSAIASAGSGEAHSSEAVRHRIRQFIDAEEPTAILSDDKLVALLRADGIDIARRTVAKYRESMQIPSSVQRRRQKKMLARGKAPAM